MTSTFHHKPNFITDINLSYIILATHFDQIWPRLGQPNHKNVNILQIHNSMCPTD